MEEKFYDFKGRIIRAKTLTNGDLRLEIDVDIAEKPLLKDFITKTEADGVMFGIRMWELE